jgi:hypothetical protein
LGGPLEVLFPSPAFANAAIARLTRSWFVTMRRRVILVVPKTRWAPLAPTAVLHHNSHNTNAGAAEASSIKPYMRSSCLS